MKQEITVMVGWYAKMSDKAEVKIDPRLKMLIFIGIVMGLSLAAGFLAGGIISCTGEYSNGKCINPQVVKMCEYEGKKYFFEDDNKINLTALDVIK